ncbi:hypothetical protein [Acidobacterium sp. S8]|uniref:hypothetical protein n=1 Tax=Acidobacterium sp. S8 TaxID=1641854 RepID=UPI00131BD008|nr:hypothetical protein [Acidobacterium sp. S8]
MQWLRFRAVFPWRIALLLALLPTIPLLIFGVWFRWELQPLERYYLSAYWESLEGAKQPRSTTQIVWLFKAAPGRKSEPVIDVDVTSERPWSLSLELSSSARERGWLSLVKSRREAVNSAKLEVFLEEDFYGHRSVRQVIAEPLLYACSAPFLVLYVAFMMKRELGIEWNRLREEVSGSELTFNLAEIWNQFAKQIRSWIGRRIVIEKAQLERDDSAIKTIPNAPVNPGTVQQVKGGPLTGEKRHLSSFLEEPRTRSIFPGRASAHDAKEQSKPWHESQWID